mmetsp:Transcript_73452/g.237722  ORF Transcript_73452/g.237722 Transcript_73452/m.237722 type:complete len:109 (+) Transcript_73452:1-327(+)
MLDACLDAVALMDCFRGQRQLPTVGRCFPNLCSCAQLHRRPTLRLWMTSTYFPMRTMWEQEQQQPLLARNLNCPLRGVFLCFAPVIEARCAAREGAQVAPPANFPRGH